MARFSAWAVAAAVLVEEGGPLHYTDIAYRVQRSGLTRLGQNGATADGTLNVILRGKKIEGRPVFRRYCRAYYDLADRDCAGELGEVQRALCCLEALREAERRHWEQKAQIRDVAAQIAKLRRRSMGLEKIAGQITGMCGEVVAKLPCRPEEC